MSADTVDNDLDRELAACRSLVPDEAEPDLGMLRAKLGANIARETGLVASLRQRPTAQRMAMVLGLGALAIGLTALVAPRADLAAFPIARTIAVVAVLGGVAVVAMRRLLRPLHRPAPSAAADRVLLVLAILAPVVAVLWPMHYEGAPAGEGFDFLRRCARCAAFGGLLALPIALAATALRRARVDGPAIAALAGVAAGMSAVVLLHVHCPITAPSHVLTGHAGLVVALAVVAAFWRR